MKKNKQGTGCLLLFFSSFILVGIGMLYMGLKDLYLQNKTSNWMPVQAHIEDVEFVTYSTKGGSSYETKCTYSYTYKNKKYSNNIIAIGYRANSNGRNQDELYEVLKYDANIVTGYVNPDNPNNAVLIKGEIMSSTISLFIIPFSIFVFIAIFFNRKNKVLFFSFSFIFVAGILLVSSGVFQTDFKKKIIVIDKKTKAEIDQMNEDFMDQYDKDHPLKEIE